MSGWAKIGTVIGKVAPLLGGVAGGPAGVIAGQVIASALGVESTPSAVAAALKSDPGAYLKLQRAEYENAEKMAAITAADRNSARKYHQHSPMPAIICCALTAMVASSGYMLFSGVIPSENQSIANIFLGAIVAKWGDSIAYWVGTTRGSAEKTNLMSK